MTRRDYEAFAAMLKVIRAGDEFAHFTIDDIEDLIVDIFEKDNVRFNAALFGEAAQP